MNEKSKSFPPSETLSNNDNLSNTFSSLYNKQSQKSDNGCSLEENIKNILKKEYE